MHSLEDLHGVVIHVSVDEFHDGAGEVEDDKDDDEDLHEVEIGEKVCVSDC